MKQLAAVLIVLIGAVAGARAQEKTPGNAENGKKLFMKNGCYECHGRAGQGGTFSAWTAPKLAPRPLALAAFMAYVRHPAPGGMPVYSEKTVPNADLTDIWAYLKSIPDSPPAKDIPLLKE